jgi:hypothetical protein
MRLLAYASTVRFWEARCRRWIGFRWSPASYKHNPWLIQLCAWHNCTAAPCPKWTKYVNALDHRAGQITERATPPKREAPLI